ncbi:MAG: cache domain-containing protein [Methylobacterium mesophilicum]|nr:cache domain-containing protein [Methylobacterium mesophilicum]
MRGLSRLAGAAALALLSSALPLKAGSESDYAGAVRDFVKAQVLPWASDPVLVDAILKQNGETADYTSEQIDNLDKEWRAEVERPQKPEIDALLGREASRFLRARRDRLNGLATEIILMDARGLNVAQTDATSDLWQGDEAKFQKSFAAGAGALFVDSIEEDESTGVLQAQVSVTITDPASGAPIGAMTVGIDMDRL